MIDVPHHGHDRAALDQVLGAVLGRLETDLDVRGRHPFHTVAEFLDHEFRGVRVDGLGHSRHDAKAHQGLDHFGAPHGHPVGQFLHRDRLGDDDLAYDLLGGTALRPALRLPLALTRAADRGQRALALGVV